MLYLAMQFAWFLAAAFALGLVMGWISADGRGLRLRGRTSGWFVALWGAGAALTWFQVLNGVPARWVESALLFSAVYVAGCLVATLLRPARRPGAVAVPAAASAGEAGASPAPVAEPGVMPPVEGEAEIPGTRPAGLVAPREGKADDLKLIKGIGRQNEGRLHGLGIWHFSQIADWTPDHVEWVGAYLAFPGRIDREGWISQAKELAAGGDTDFSRRARAGLVETSRDDGSRGEDNVAEGGIEGERPKNLLAAARDGKPDDLELVKGIGPAIAADLNRLGIWHFEQLAALGDEELRYASAFAGVSGRGLAENWREDADILAHGGETAHSRAVKAERQKTPGA